MAWRAEHWLSYPRRLRRIKENYTDDALSVKFFFSCPQKGLRPIRNEQGITHLALMFVVVILGLSLMVVNQHWSVMLKRDREKELAFRGNRMKAAIERYAADFEVPK